MKLSLPSYAGGSFPFCLMSVVCVRLFSVFTIELSRFPGTLGIPACCPWFVFRVFSPEPQPFSLSSRWCLSCTRTTVHGVRRLRLVFCSAWTGTPVRKPFLALGFSRFRARIPACLSASPSLPAFGSSWDRPHSCAESPPGRQHWIESGQARGSSASWRLLSACLFNDV